MGYFSFYRYYACKKWWSFRKDRDQISPFENEEEFRNKLLEKYEYFLDKFIEKTEPNKVVFAFDAMDGKNWRKELYPQYKSTRVKNEDIFRYLVITKNLVNKNQKYRNISVIEEVGKEADDIIAQEIKKIRNSNNEEINIIASDLDYLQLIEDNNKIYLRDLNFKNLSDNKLTGRKYLLRKIIHGDKSDNITAIFKGKNSTRKKEILFEKIVECDDYDNVSEKDFDHVDDYNKFILNYTLVKL